MLLKLIGESGKTQDVLVLAQGNVVPVVLLSCVTTPLIVYRFVLVE